MKYQGCHFGLNPLDATFSGIPLTESFLRERIHSENLYEIICNIFSGRFGVH